jgi:hypothetical protein
MRRQGGYPKPQMTREQSLQRLVTDLASMGDERLLAETVDTMMRRYKVDRRVLECKLLASQDSRRRFLARRVG